MIRPILAYGHPMLLRSCEEIGADFPDLEQLIVDMWQTMESAHGCGLAASQIGVPARLFIVDSQTSFEHMDPVDRRFFVEHGDSGIREIFINARILERSLETWEDEEGCLSIPNLSDTISRSWSVRVAYQDKEFRSVERSFYGLTARMIQHEYDHTEGVLYLEYLPKRSLQLIQRKLHKIVTGKIKPHYPMKFL